MAQHVKIELYTREAQRLITAPQLKKYSLVTKVSRKFSIIWSNAVKNNKVEALVTALTCHNRLFYLNQDLQSEINKYSSIIGKQTAISTMKKQFSKKTIVIKAGNPLIELLCETLLLSDQLILLILACNIEKKFEDRRTPISQINKLKARLGKTLGRINQMPVKYWKNISIKEYLLNTELLPEVKRNKVIMALESSIFIKKNKQRAVNE